MEIRAACEEDIPAIIRLLGDDDLGRQRESNHSDARDAYRAAFQDVSDDPRSGILVAQDGDRLIGCIMYSCLSGLSFQGLKRLLVEDLRVDAVARRMGVGRALMKEVEHIAQARGCTMLELFVHASREPAVAFYEELGFEGNHLGMRRMLSR